MGIDDCEGIGRSVDRGENAPSVSSEPFARAGVAPEVSLESFDGVADDFEHDARNGGEERRPPKRSAGGELHTPAGPLPIHLIAAPTGTGKTSLAAEFVAGWGGTCWCTDRIEDVDRTVAAIEKHGGQVGRVLPLVETCTHHKTVEYWQAKGHSYRSGFCPKKCELQGDPKECSFLRSIDELQEAENIVVTKAMARRPARKKHAKLDISPDLRRGFYGIVPSPCLNDFFSYATTTPVYTCRDLREETLHSLMAPNTRFGRAKHGGEPSAEMRSDLLNLSAPKPCLYECLCLHSS